DIGILEPFILLQRSMDEKLTTLKNTLSSSITGLKGLEEMEEIISYLKALHPKFSFNHLEIDITLARRLNYYTGAIFEVKTNEAAMGSIGGGGRYDDLTGMFGLKGL